MNGKQKMWRWKNGKQIFFLITMKKSPDFFLIHGPKKSPDFLKFPWTLKFKTGLGPDFKKNFFLDFPWTGPEVGPGKDRVSLGPRGALIRINLASTNSYLGNRPIGDSTGLG